jgi:hypothetical protein
MLVKREKKGLQVRRRSALSSKKVVTVAADEIPALLRAGRRIQEAVRQKIELSAGPRREDRLMLLR